MSSFHVPVKSMPEVTGSPRLTGAGAAAGSGAAASAACRRAACRAEPRVARLISFFARSFAASFLAIVEAHSRGPRSVCRVVSRPCGGVSPLLLIEPCLHDSQEQIFAFPIIQRETTKMIRVFDETNADFASEQDDWHLTAAIAFGWRPDAAAAEA